MLKRGLTIVAGLLCCFGALGCSSRPENAAGEPPDDRFALIPLPAELVAGDGEVRLDAETRVALSDPASAELRRIAELWAEPLRRTSGLPLPVAAEAASPEAANTVRLVLRPEAENGETGREDRPELFGDELLDRATCKYYSHSELMKRVFGIDVLECPRCSGRPRRRSCAPGTW